MPPKSKDSPRKSSNGSRTTPGSGTGKQSVPSLASSTSSTPTRLPVPASKAPNPAPIISTTEAKSAAPVAATTSQPVKETAGNTATRAPTPTAANPIPAAVPVHTDTLNPAAKAPANSTPIPSVPTPTPYTQAPDKSLQVHLDKAQQEDAAKEAAPSQQATGSVEEGASSSDMPKCARPLHPVQRLLGETVVNGAGVKVNPADFIVDEGVIGLYFGAKWCPPCRALVPGMQLLYEEVRSAGHSFQLVYISCDHNEESFKACMAAVSWWAVHYDDEERRSDIGRTYGVHGIPMLVLLDATTDLSVINKEARFFIGSDPRGEKFPWRDMSPPSVVDILSLIKMAAENVAEALASTQGSTSHELAEQETGNGSPPEVKKEEGKAPPDPHTKYSQL